MKIYAISLPRSVQRYEYIQEHLSSLNLDYELVSAVDGSKLTVEEILNICDKEVLENFRWWLNNGAIGCALSHLNVYRKIIASGDKSGFIIEDDVILSHDISSILNELKREIRPNEVILIYYASPKHIGLSSEKTTKLKKGSLHFPISFDQPLTTAAYVIGHEAAKNMINAVTPIDATADSWHHHFKRGGFDSIRFLYPSPVNVMHFKSSINYRAKWNPVRIATYMIDKFRLPWVYSYLNQQRYKEVKRREANFKIENRPSPFSGSTT